MSDTSKLIELAARFRRDSELFRSLRLQPRAEFYAEEGREEWGIWRLRPQTPETASGWVTFSLLAALAIEELGIRPVPAPKPLEFDPKWRERLARSQEEASRHGRIVDYSNTIPDGLDAVDPCVRAWLHFLRRESIKNNNCAVRTFPDGWEASAVQLERSARERIQAELQLTQTGSLGRRPDDTTSKNWSYEFAFAEFKKQLQGLSDDPASRLSLLSPSAQTQLVDAANLGRPDKSEVGVASYQSTVGVRESGNKLKDTPESEPAIAPLTTEPNTKKQDLAEARTTGDSTDTVITPKRNSIGLEQEISIELDPEVRKALEAAILELASVQSALGQNFEGIDWNSVREGLEVLRARQSDIEAAVDVAVPLTPTSRKEYWELLHKFSTDGKGLGLSEEQFEEMMEQDGEEWLERYRAWRGSRGKLLIDQPLSPRGRGGRRQREQTRKLHHAWVGKGRPEITARLCDELARDFFPTEWTKVKRGSKKHKNLRDRIRSAIQRFETSLATKLIS